MLYLVTSPGEAAVRDLLDRHRVGLISQPGSNPASGGWIWAADNGCFGSRWVEDRWARWLDRQPRAGCLFAVVPDVVADADATLERWDRYSSVVRDLRFPVAFVLQDGATIDTVPFSDADAVFVGGSTAWKESESAYRLAARARDLGLWVHVGRVNTRRRFRAWAGQADSADGSILSFGPATNVPRVEGWITDLEQSPVFELPGA